ncbi:hypothetical protein [Streptomyces lunalinharesii]|uniref:Uncharacterized protein n=1 Tax=Streptomyces lunalinharesii TaxID=333384 RepID=A0ABN3SY36_9ACTN
MSARRPEVGDLMTNVLTDAEWVCTDIAGAATDTPVWLLRPRHGADPKRFLRVDHRDIVTYAVTAPRGEWGQP